MYYCECGRLLNEFDVRFHENLFGENEQNAKKCFCCRAGKELKRYDDGADNLFLCRIVLALCSVWILLLGVLALVAFLAEWGYVEESVAYTVSKIAMAIAWVSIFPFEFLIIPIVLNFKLIHEYDSYSEGYTQITFVGKNKAEVKNVEGGYNGKETAGCFRTLILIFTGIFWILPYSLYTVIIKPIRYRIKIPAEAFAAYRKTKAEVHEILVSDADLMERGLESRKKEYEKKVRNIRDKYSVLGEDVVREKMQSIELPIVTTAKCKILECKKYGSSKLFFVALQDQSGKIIGGIVRDQYWVCCDRDWLEAWKLLGASQETLDMMQKIAFP